MRSSIVKGPSHTTPRPQAPIAPDPGGSFSEVMKRLGKEVDRGERVVHHALDGNPFANDAQGMIALQAGVYRYVEAVDLVSRLVDRATGAVRTTLQSQ